MPGRHVPLPAAYGSTAARQRAGSWTTRVVSDPYLASVWHLRATIDSDDECYHQTHDIALTFAHLHSTYAPFTRCEAGSNNDRGAAFVV